MLSLSSTYICMKYTVTTSWRLLLSNSDHSRNGTFSPVYPQTRWGIELNSVCISTLNHFICVCLLLSSFSSQIKTNLLSCTIMHQWYFLSHILLCSCFIHLKSKKEWGFTAATKSVLSWAGGVLERLHKNMRSLRLDESHNNSHSRSDCKLFRLDFLMLKPQFLQWSYMGLPMCAAFSIMKITMYFCICTVKWELSYKGSTLEV